ncbi:hypothetical protein [Stratiformator vulcanicus]|uniref:Uncharacterized protein n=1 Tax=Stratiformator vulcanicus TaxID=2527980 RepID=A0A517QW57_9PLAN|nr:hypothetical protein [Stratiformator vulcanicus]QDT35902.1 hypothetical protein Pan189_02550 [Stratiformator vulcanicus]
MSQLTLDERVTLSPLEENRGGETTASRIASANQVPVNKTAALRVSPERILLALVGIIATLVVIGIASRLTIYSVAPNFHDDPQAAPKIARLLSRFDLGFEPSVSAWYSSLALCASAGTLAIVGLLHRSRNEPSVMWFLLGIIFVGLSLDEMVMFHETLDNTLRSRLGTGGLLHFAWVIPASLLVLAVGLTYLRFLMNLPLRTRALFLLAGGLFVGGAIGVELLEGAIVDSGGLNSVTFTLVQALEEGLEMIGVAVFLYALLDYLRKEFGVFPLNWSQNYLQPEQSA